MTGIAVLARGLCCPASGVAEILAGSPLFRRHPEFIGIDGMRQVGGYVESCLAERDLGRRLAHLLHRAYDDCVAELPDAGPWPLFLALPSVLNKVPAMLRCVSRRRRRAGFPPCGVD